MIHTFSFVDDHPGNVDRAASRGLQVHLYKEHEAFVRSLAGHCPILRQGAAA